MGKDYEETDWDNWEYNENDDGTPPKKDEVIIVKDGNGNLLTEGDTVAAIKDLKVKGMKDIKRGDKFTKIRFTDEEGIIESGKMVLKTEFFKKI